MTDLPQRKNIRLNNFDYASNEAYFVTICVKNRRALLGNITKNCGSESVGATVPGRPLIELSQIGNCVNQAIDYIDKNTNDVSIPKFVIMPNHIHAIFILERKTTGDRGRSPLQTIIRNMKSYLTKQIGYSIWQKSFYDYIIRNEEDYLIKWNYIDINPVKWEDDEYYRKDGCSAENLS